MINSEKGNGVIIFHAVVEITGNVLKETKYFLPTYGPDKHCFPISAKAVSPRLMICTYAAIPHVKQVSAALYFT